MAITIDPHQFLGRWLKEHPHANQMHRVLRFDRETLVCYCGRTFPVSDAFIPSLAYAVRYCPDCTGLWQKQEADRQRATIKRATERSSHVISRK